MTSQQDQSLLLKARLDAWQARTEADRERLVAFMAVQPATKPCNRHPHVQREIDLEATRTATHAARNNLTPGYASCPECLAAEAEAQTRARLARQGVPATLCGCTLENWRPRTPADKKHLESVRSFAGLGRGFLLLVKPDDNNDDLRCGVGKTHLAVGVMRQFKNSRFLTQSGLLRALRQTYRDQTAPDVISQCQDTGLLVLDEIGVSSGGKDEAPALYEILSVRHADCKPTILTSNLSWTELGPVMDERILDRLATSAYIVTLDGTSYRPEMRDDYFRDSAPLLVQRQAD